MCNHTDCVLGKCQETDITTEHALEVAAINLEILAIAFEIESEGEEVSPNVDMVLQTADQLKDFVWSL